MATESAVFESLKYRIEVDDFGTRRYYNSAGQVHRNDGPAVIYAGVARGWFLHGVEYAEQKYHARLRKPKCVQGVATKNDNRD